MEYFAAQIQGIGKSYPVNHTFQLVRGKLGYQPAPGFDPALKGAGVGIDALFMEVHPNPENALSDGANSLSFDMIDEIIAKVVAIDAIVR